MSRTSFQSVHCSLARTADIVGDKWCLLILRDVFLGSTAFSQFQKNLGIARNVLTSRLETLVAEGILERRRTKPGVERFGYHFTERGQELVPILIALMQWGDRWIFGEDNKPLELLDRRSGMPIEKIQVLSEGGSPLSLNDISAVAGPGASERIRAAFDSANKK